MFAPNWVDVFEINHRLIAGHRAELDRNRLPTEFRDVALHQCGPVKLGLHKGPIMEQFHFTGPGARSPARNRYRYLFLSGEIFNWPAGGEDFAARKGFAFALCRSGLTGPHTLYGKATWMVTP
jgi:hypothetical protein